MDFKKQLEEKQERVNSYLEELLKQIEAPREIVEAMSYSLMIGGKRIRPVLTLSIGEALGGSQAEIMPFAAAIEFIHTYSLIHDDLPAMDNDSMRRGKPTNHKVFGEAFAILAGDGLLNYAFETMLDAAENFGCRPKFIRAASLVAKASGARGMIGGQVIDIKSEGRSIDIDTLYEMHSKKTGALIEASCLIGGILSEREDKLQNIAEYSKNLGFAFQIVDDILDYVGDSKKLGKSVGKDRENGKSTFISLLGISESKKLASEYSYKAREIADDLDPSGFLSKLTEFLLNRDY